MKKLKAGFLGAVALLAMSFTVADHEGVFKKDAPFNCLQGSGYYSQITTALGTLTQDLSDCPEVDFTCANLGTGTLNPEEIPCEGGSAFCCARIITPNTCSGTFPTRVEIACKPQ